jgi:hypothetical protein
VVGTFCRNQVNTKKEPRHEIVTIGCEGEVIATLRWVIIPDTHNPRSPRWRAWEKAGNMIRTRSQVACAFRRWRAKGGRREKGVDPLVSFLHDAILELVGEGGLA